MSKIRSASTARKEIIFVIENQEVVETNMYDHVMQSLDKCTSPRGVMGKYFTESFNKNVGIEDEYDDTGMYTTVIKWGLFHWVGGQKKKLVDSWNTQEEAEDELYTRVYKYDFLSDDQRDTMWFKSTTEAEEEISKRTPDIKPIRRSYYDRERDLW